MPSFEPTPTVPDDGEPDEQPGRGTAIGRFLVLGPLGVGGMGMVLLAYDPDLDRKVALKLLRGDVWRDRVADGHQALVREAQAMARLAHPNVVAVHEVGAFAGGAYVVMELVDGRTLREWLNERPRPWPEIIDVLRQAGQGLAAAHRAGLVHRDFKPDNVLVGNDGRPRISDFGLASESAGVVGTRGYMSPEQQAGERGDATVDQYAFCVSAWEALTGERPAAAPRPPAEGRAPRWVFEALARGLAVRPEERWPAMDELLAALRPRTSLLARAAPVLIAAFVVGGAAYLAGRARQPVAACDGGAALVAPLWDDAVRARVAAAFRATGRPYAEDTFARVDAALRRGLATWAAAHRDACEATRVRHEQSDTLLDLRMRCLARAKSETASLVALFEQADADTVDRATPAATRAVDVDACADVVRLAAAVPPPADSTTARAVDAMRGDLARLVALRRLGKWRDGLREGHALLLRARAAGYAPLTAAVSLQAGRFELDAGSTAAGTELLHEAVALASSPPDEDVVAEAASHLVFAFASDHKFDAASVTYRFASAAAARTGPSVRHVIRLLSYGGRMLNERGYHAQALTLLELCRSLEERLFGAQSYEVARSDEDVADAMDRVGRVVEAGQRYAQAVDTLAKVVGPEHPAVARLLEHYGFNRMHGFDFARAGTLLERALAINERAFGPDHRRVAAVLYVLAIVRQAEEKLDEGRAMIERALRIDDLEKDEVTRAIHQDVLAGILRQQGDAEGAHRMAQLSAVTKRNAYGEQHPGLAFTVQQDAENLLALGRTAEARAAIDQAMAILEKAVAADHPDLADALGVRARVESAEGRDREAVATHERALAIIEKAYGPDSPALARQLLGMCDLVLDAGDVRRGREVAERALRATASGAPVLRAAAQLRAARARWAAGEDRAAALAEARALRGKLSPLFARDELARVDRWLASAARR